MKKVLLTAIMALGLVSGLSAQGKGSVEFGFGIGYNMSTASDSENTADSGSGFNAAASAEYYFSDRWGIKARLMYDQKGWNNGSINNLDTGDFYTTDFNLNYLTIPVMANWHFAKKRNWYLNFGPYVGFLLSAEETEGGLDLKDGFNNTDFGIALGIGVKIPVSDKLKVFIEYDGQSGLSDIFKESTSAVQNARSSFNVGLNFMMK